jgi:hypothetical protein
MPRTCNSSAIPRKLVIPDHLMSSTMALANPKELLAASAETVFGSGHT